MWTHVWELARKKWTVSLLCVFWEPRHHHQTVTRGSHIGWLPVRHALGKRRTPRVPEHQVANLVSKCGHEVWTASTGSQATGPQTPAQCVGVSLFYRQWGLAPSLMKERGPKAAGVREDGDTHRCLRLAPPYRLRYVEKVGITLVFSWLDSQYLPSTWHVVGAQHQFVDETNRHVSFFPTRQ